MESKIERGEIMSKGKKIVMIILLCFISFVGGIISTKISIANKNKKLDNSIIYQVRVDVEKINVREDIDLSSKIYKEVYKGEVLDVVKYYEGNNYNWYQIMWGDHQIGWIASAKTNSWVTVLNNNGGK